MEQQMVESGSHALEQPVVGQEFLSFRIGAEEYGIDILKVQEIRGFEAPTRMFHAPAAVLGVLNLRGVIVPVLDLRLTFGLALPAYDRQTVTIVLTVGGRVIGMVVDSVSDVLALPPASIRPAPHFNGAAHTEHVIGIATVQHGDSQRMLILLDIEQLMTSPAMGLVPASAD